MTKHQPHADSNAMLASLPNPRSPAALDEHILNQAREQAEHNAQHHAKRRTHALPLPWLGGLTTAGIAGIALMIALQPAPDTVSDANRDAVLEEAVITAPMPSPSEDQEGESVESGAPIAPSAAAPALPDRGSRYRAKASLEEKMISAKRKSTTTTTMPEITVEQMAPRTLHRYPEVIGDEQFMPADIARRIEECANLPSLNTDATAAPSIEGRPSSRVSPADSCYRQLQDNCSHCQLPETLEEAQRQTQEMQ